MGYQKAKVPAYSFPEPSWGKSELQGKGTQSEGRGQNGVQPGQGEVHRVSYRIPQPLQVWGLQHEGVKHLLSLPPHIQQN